jgi:hypothetical protein
MSKYKKKTKNKQKINDKQLISESFTFEESLKSALDESSIKNRNLFITFLIFVIYVFAVVYSTDDMQLMIPNSKVHLPILNLNVSLIVFYVSTPVYYYLFIYESVV